MNLFKPISISLSPNTEKDDIFLAWKLKFQPWRFKKGEKIKELEEEFKKYLGVKHAISFNSGRSAFLAILNLLGLEKNDEVLLQAFTCNAAANPIIWSGLKPVYVDCDEKTFNIDIEDLERKITPKSRAVVVQHTFGLPADLDEILKICQKNNLILIEDCAHSLGSSYGGKKIGTFGQLSFFSFSRDKVISSVYGGMAVTNDDELAKKLKDFQEKIGYPSYFWIFQQLLHPILMNWLILPTYKILGKYLLVLFQWFRILSKAVHWKEKRGKKPAYFPKRLPNALAELALNQFKKLDKFNSHRKEIAKIYFETLKNSSFILPQNLRDVFPEEGIFLRFTIKHPKAHEIIKKAWQRNILIGDWYTTPIAPHDTKLEKMKYILGSCPKAEKLAKQVLNLPTHINISLDDAQKITAFLYKYGLQPTHRVSRKNMKIKLIENKKFWEDFLLGCEGKTFLDSWNWGEFNKMMGNKIWRLGIFDGGKLVGTALISKITAKRGTFLLIQHGPVISGENKKNETLQILLDELKKIGKEEGVSFIRMNPLWECNSENQNILKNLGFKEAPMHANTYEATWKLDITPSEEEILKNMRKTTRYLIRQTLKNQDISVEKSERLDDFEIYQRLNEEVAKRQRFVPFSFEFIKNEFEVFSKDNQVLWFFGKYKGEVAAAALVIFWSGIGFYHQAASTAKYAKFSIPYLLAWEAIKEAKRRGCFLFDFWGYVNPKENPNHPWAGPTLFKMGFGGRAYEYVKTQDFPLSKKYWLTFLFEKLRKTKRGL